MSLIEQFLVNPNVQWQFVDMMADLTATAAANACPVMDSKYRIDPPSYFRVDPGQAFVVHGLVYWAGYRANTGLTSEYFRLISPNLAHGCFVYEPRVGNSSPIVGNINHAGRATTAGANNSDRKQHGGTCAITDNPALLAEVAKQSPPMFVINDNDAFYVLFSLVQDAVANPIEGRWAIGTVNPAVPAPPRQRVDFAGVTVVGQTMSRSYYDRTLQRRMNDLGL